MEGPKTGIWPGILGSYWGRIAPQGGGQLSVYSHIPYSFALLTQPLFSAFAAYLFTRGEAALLDSR